MGVEYNMEQHKAWMDAVQKTYETLDERKRALDRQRVAQSKSLVCDVSDKTEGELWEFVREACRIDSVTWRAYERLHSNYRELKRFHERR